MSRLLVGLSVFMVMLLAGCDTLLPSKVSSLSSLTLTAAGASVPLTPGFSPGRKAYSAEVASGVTSVDVYAVTKDGNAKASVVGGKSLVDGANTLIITVTAESGDRTVYTVTVQRTVAPSGVWAGATDVWTKVGSSVRATAYVLPANALQQVTWSSSNPTIASVDSNGNVSGVSLGEAVITATTAVGGYTATQTAHVVSNATVILPTTDVDLLALAPNWPAEYAIAGQVGTELEPSLSGSKISGVSLAQDAAFVYILIRTSDGAPSAAGVDYDARFYNVATDQSNWYSLRIWNGLPTYWGNQLWVNTGSFSTWDASDVRVGTDSIAARFSRAALLSQIGTPKVVTVVVGSCLDFNNYAEAPAIKLVIP